MALSRRRFLVLGGAAALPILAACAAATPTAAPSKPAEPAKPAAPPAAPPAVPTNTPEPAKPAAPPAAPPAGPTNTPAASGAAAPAAKPAGSAGMVNLRFMKFAPPGWTLDQTVTENWNKANPNVQVKIEEVIYGEMDKKVQTLAAADQMGDVFPGHNRWAPLHWAKGITLDLEPYIRTAPADLKMEDFYPGVLADARGFGGDGKLFCLPTVMHAGGNAVVAFNLDLLDKAGLKMPTKDWTIQQYEELVRKGAKPAEGIFGTHINFSAPLYAAQAIRSWSSTPEKSSDDTWYISRDGKKQQLDSPPVKAALEWYNKMVVDKIAPTQTDYNTATTANANHFNVGKMLSRAMESSSPHSTQIAVGDKFKIGYTLWPKGPAGHRGTALSYNLHNASSKTKAPDEAFKFMMALTSPEIAFQYAFEGVGQPYARRSAWTNPKLWEKYPGVKEVSEWIDTGVDPYPRPYNLRAQEHQNIMVQELQAYLDGKENWEQMFAHAQKKGQEVVDLPRP